MSVRMRGRIICLQLLCYQKCYAAESEDEDEDEDDEDDEDESPDDLEPEKGEDVNIRTAKKIVTLLCSLLLCWGRTASLAALHACDISLHT